MDRAIENIREVLAPVFTQYGIRQAVKRPVDVLDVTHIQPNWGAMPRCQ